MVVVASAKFKHTHVFLDVSHSGLWYLPSSAASSALITHSNGAFHLLLSESNTQFGYGHGGLNLSLSASQVEPMPGNLSLLFSL